jgi:hypothetical protein
MAERGLVLTGARARLSLQGVPIMYTLNAAYGEQIQLDPVEPLDQFDVAEFVPTAYRCTFTAQIVRVITASVKLHNGLTIFPTLENILSAAEMTATIEDNVSGRVVANIERVRASRYQISVGARGIVLTDVEFTAIRIRDESKVQ